MAGKEIVFTLPPQSTTVVDDGTAYRVPNSSLFRFPFVPLDPTPGGGNLGRIEWHLESFPMRKVKGQKRIGALAIWATSTRDPRYTNRIFFLPCFTNGVMSTRGAQDHYMHRVWFFGFCDFHGHPSFSAYPDNQHTALVVNISSSIGDELYFE